MAYKLTWTNDQMDEMGEGEEVFETLAEVETKLMTEFAGYIYPDTYDAIEDGEVDMDAHDIVREITGVETIELTLEEI